MRSMKRWRQRLASYRFGRGSAFVKQNGRSCVIGVTLIAGDTPVLIRIPPRSDFLIGTQVIAVLTVLPRWKS